MKENETQLILGILGYAVQRGIDAQQLCKLADINLAALQHNADPKIAPRQLDALWSNAMHLTDDPLFGLHVGESLQLAALGIVGEIIKSSSTVGDAVTIASSLIGMVTDLFEMKIQRSKKSFVISLHPLQPSANPITQQQMSDLLMVFMVHELDGLLLKKIKPIAVRLSYAPSNLAHYQRVFRCDNVKKGNVCSAEFTAELWSEPIIVANHEAQKFLLQQIKNNKRDVTAASSMKERISQFLLTHAYLGVLSLDDVAANFNVSSRSLQRKLQAEDVTYQQIADAIRQSLATEYVRTGAYPLKEISTMLGYNELSAFSRAFKRWTGKSPGEYYYDRL